jgi:hypothetical protein
MEAHIMDIGKSVTYFFQDKRWFSKLLIGWLVNLVPILNFAFTGYVTETIRNVETNMEDPLPEWDGFGEKFVLGFFVWLAGIVYSIPLIILSIIFIIPAAVAGNEQNSNAVTGILAGTTIVFACIAIIYALALTLFLPAMNINLARKRTIGSVFEIGEFFRIFRVNTGDYLVAWIMSLVWGIVIGVIGGLLITFLLIIPCVGWIAAFIIGALMTVAIPLIYAHLFGQVAAKDTLAPA